MMEVDVWVVVNDAGDSEVYTDEGDTDSHGLSGACRIVKLTVKVPKPKAVEVVVTVPDEPDAATVTAG